MTKSQLRNGSLSITACCFTLATAAATLAGCSGATEKEGTFVLIDDRGRGEPNLTFGGVKLTTRDADVIKLCDERGWKHNIEGKGGDQRANIVPSGHADVRKFGVIFEDGVLIQVTVEFHKGDPARATISKEYAHRRRMPDGAWAMSDGRRQTVVIVNRDGTRLHAVHVARLRDRAEANKLLAHFVEGAAAKPADKADPKPEDAKQP